MERSKRNIKIQICIVIILLIFVLVYIFSNREVKREITPRPEYITAVHYFADGWPINFWNCEWDNLENDLRKIKGDGFNTIILVIPWREFQPDTQKMKYNNIALKKLEHLLTIIDQSDLYVEVRLGYLNDYYGEEDPAERFYDIVGDIKIQKAWLNYIDKIYSVCRKHTCFIGGFIAWEEFWHNYALVDYVGGTEKGIEFAYKSGFQQYIRENYGIEEFNKRFKQGFNSCEEIYVPKRDDLYAGEWFSYIDNFTLKLLKDSRAYFPELTMEVRTDADKVGTLDGNSADHITTWDCMGGNYTAIMYLPHQGWTNSSLEMSAGEALESLEKWLKYISQKNGQTPVFMEQFLFTDNTPGYEGNAKIKESDLAEYLSDAGKILAENTVGYGIWVYKDYKTNMLYNSQFALDLDGWDSENVKIEKVDGSSKAHMFPESYLCQRVPATRKFADGSRPVLEMDIINLYKEDVSLTVEIEDQRYVINVDKNDTYFINFMEDAFGCLKIYSEGEVYIDNIKYYEHYQSGLIYSENGEEELCIPAIRELNRILLEEE